MAEKEFITREEFLDGIGATPELCRAAGQGAVTPEQYNVYKQLFRRSRELFYEEVNKQEGSRRRFLFLYLGFAYEAHEEYARRGIPDAVYFDTFRDIPIWAENCRRDHGELGIAQYDWLQNHVRLGLFRLGRLQYEPVEAMEDTELNGRKLYDGELALNLHIPQGEPLDYDKCRNSLGRAKSFFAGLYPDKAIKEITCHSWLLGPALKELLPAQSNIMRFQTLFQIYAFDAVSREAEERVFGRVTDQPEEYPERTGLQRALKEYLLTGKKPGSGLGRVRNEYIM